jgi:rubredoxin
MSEKIIFNQLGVRSEEWLKKPMFELIDKDISDQFVENILHPDGLLCPRCKGEDRIRFGLTSNGFQSYRCKKCDKIYSALTGSIFSGTAMDSRRLVVFMRMLGMGGKDSEISKQIDLVDASVAG